MGLCGYCIVPVLVLSGKFFRADRWLYFPSGKGNAGLNKGSALAIIKNNGKL